MKNFNKLSVLAKTDLKESPFSKKVLNDCPFLNDGRNKENLDESKWIIIVMVDQFHD